MRKGKFMKKLSCFVFLCAPTPLLFSAQAEIHITINSESTPLNLIQTQVQSPSTNAYTNTIDAKSKEQDNHLCTIRKRIATSGIITLAGATEIALMFYDPGNSEWGRLLAYVGMTLSGATFLESASSLIFMPREVQNAQPCTFWNKLHKLIASPVCMAASLVPFTSKWRFISLALGGSWGACIGGVITLNHIAKLDGIRHRR
jgi:hypothetical protein